MTNGIQDACAQRAPLSQQRAFIPEWIVQHVRAIQASGASCRLEINFHEGIPQREQTKINGDLRKFLTSVPT